MNNRGQPIPQVSDCSQDDQEQFVVRNFIRAAESAGVRAGPESIINFYVSLKSRLQVVLAGPAQTGKIALVRSLARVLTGYPSGQFQFAKGHAYWASNSQDVSLFVEMQARFNRSKLLALIEEAAQPENRNKLYVACLTRISPAELYEYFSLGGLQFWPDQMWMTNDPTVAPIPYPPNFRLIGTMDTARYVWWDTDLLTHSTVVRWSGEKVETNVHGSRETTLLWSTSNFLRHCVRSEQRAYAKLRRILEGAPQVFLPLIQVLITLEETNVILPHEVMKRAVIFLANAWSEGGEGLFTSSLRPNLNLALDLVLAQLILPWIIAVTPDSKRPLKRLARLFNGQFSETSAFMNTLTSKSWLPLSYQPNYS